MNIKETANRLVELCRKGENTQAYEELFAENAMAQEPGGEDVKGLDALKAKSKQFKESIVEMHSMEVSDPVVCGMHFSVGMSMDVTFKEHGRRKDEEICVYETNKEGKIIKEQFFYPMG